MQVTIIALIVVESLLAKIIGSTSSDYSDTPSPEWVKYQQERNDPKYNRHNVNFTPHPGVTTKMSPLQTSTTSVNLKSPAVVKVQAKMESSSRQSNNNHHNEEMSNEPPHLDMDWKGEDDNSNTEEFDDSKSSGLVPSVSGFIKFLKSLKRTWMKNSLFRMDNKIKYLHTLKNTFRRAIEDKFFALFPDADPEVAKAMDKVEGRHLRQKRGILGESNINFPPEAALMSINFLTFAVFLIKLVMQVVNIVKSKHYQFSAMGMNGNSFFKG